MTSTIMHEFIRMIEDETQSRPTPIEFEMAYHVRVAIDRIKFAIKHTEQFGPRTDGMREVGFQLLDALERLKSADRDFQKRFRARPAAGRNESGDQQGAGKIRFAARHDEPV